MPGKANEINYSNSEVRNVNYADQNGNFKFII